ncbi:variant leucine-rich repeat-containing protein [Acidipropionibacterium acidipropionici]
MAKDLSIYSAADLADPSIDAGTLAQLAQFRPDLWPQIIGSSGSRV